MAGAQKKRGRERERERERGKMVMGVDRIRE